METEENFEKFDTDIYFIQYVRDEYHKDVVDFIRIINKDGKDFIVIKDIEGVRSEHYVDYKHMVHWLINNYPNGI